MSIIFNVVEFRFLLCCCVWPIRVRLSRIVIPSDRESLSNGWLLAYVVWLVFSCLSTVFPRLFNVHSNLFHVPTFFDIVFPSFLHVLTLQLIMRRQFVDCFSPPPNS